MHTAHEAFMENFVFRLLERKNCPPNICDSVLDSTEYRGKVKIIENLIGKRIEKFAKEIKFDEYFVKLQKIKEKRNKFIHTGVVHKKIDKKIGDYTFPEYVDLDTEDLIMAVSFAELTIHFFAKLYTAYGKWEPPEWEY